MQGGALDAAERERRRGRNVGVGCLTALAGMFSGGMVAVLVAKVAGNVNGCVPPQGLPACDWHRYAFVGMLIGVVTLPVATLMRLRRGDARADTLERG